MRFLYSAIGCLLSFFSYSQLPIALKEEFDDNSSGWWTGEETGINAQIHDGKYFIQTNHHNQGRYSTISTAMMSGKEFSLEASFIQQDGSINNGFGLLWGSDGKRHFEFIISTDGHFKIKNAEGGEEINKWFNCAANPVGISNILRVESKNAKWYYYLNEEEVAVTSELKLYGSRIGIINYTDMKLEVDYIHLRQDVGIKLPDNLTTGLVKENLGSNINSKYEELGPLIMADGNTLYFGVKNSPQNIGGESDREDVWYSTSDDGLHWRPRKNPGAGWNDSEANNLADISDDGRTMLYCKTDGFQIRRRIHSEWLPSQNISPGFINESEHMEANLSPDEKVILFSAKFNKNIFYDTSINEKDLYITQLQKNGTWSEPVNLGKQINTEGDEIAPFLAADGRTLYFGSNGRPGYGSYDIYMSRRISDDWTQWTEPVNLGPDFNGPGFDAYYTLSAKADYAYLVSNSNSYGKSDIVRIKLPETLKPHAVIMLSGETLNSDTKSPVSAKIFFEASLTGSDVGITLSSEEDGQYSRMLNPGIYTIRAMAEGYLPVIEELKMENVTRYTEIKKDLLLVPIKKGEVIRLTHVNFYQGKAILKTDSYQELDRLAETLLQNPTVKIELEGHTDNVGNTSLLMKLSHDRVKAVKSYLVKKGITKNRISGRGFGPKRPLLPNNSEENREKNRRVEFKILSK